MTKSIDSRLRALEKPAGRNCLECEIAGINGKPQAACLHPAKFELVDALKGINERLKESLHGHD